jgi:hypothetical protein
MQPQILIAYYELLNEYANNITSRISSLWWLGAPSRWSFGSGEKLFSL